MRTSAIGLVCAMLLGLIETTASAAEHDYLKFKEFEIETKWKDKDKARGKQLELELETGATIPMDGKSGAFGYGALSNGLARVLILATHLPITDSKQPASPSGFHTHVLDLKPPSAACVGATYEIDLEKSRSNSGFDTGFEWSIKGSKVELEKVPAGEIGDSGIESLISFVLKPVLDAQQKPTNLCISVVEQI